MDEPPILDRARLDLITRGDAALANEFLGDLIAEATDVLEQLGPAIASGDRFAVADLAHRLKGMSAEIGALRLRAAAAALEAEDRPERWGEGIERAVMALHELRSLAKGADG
jgi:HPt (histidine-containing phosphotransfer) domain-containing protein